MRRNQKQQHSKHPYESTSTSSNAPMHQTHLHFTPTFDKMSDETVESKQRVAHTCSTSNYDSPTYSQLPKKNSQKSFKTIDRMNDENFEQSSAHSQFSMAKQVTEKDLNASTDIMCKHITLSNLMALLELYFEKTGSTNFQPKYRGFLLQPGNYTSIDVLVLIEHIEVSLLSLTSYVKDKSIKESELVNLAQFMERIDINRRQTAMIYLIDSLRFGLLTPQCVVKGCTIARKSIAHYDEHKVIAKPNMNQLSDSIQSFSFVKECSRSFVMDNVENIGDKPSEELQASFMQKVGHVVKTIVGWEQTANNDYSYCDCSDDLDLR